jgi:hypothetical protein
LVLGRVNSVRWRPLGSCLALKLLATTTTYGTSNTCRPAAVSRAVRLITVTVNSWISQNGQTSSSFKLDFRILTVTDRLQYQRTPYTRCRPDVRPSFHPITTNPPTTTTKFFDDRCILGSSSIRSDADERS